MHCLVFDISADSSRVLLTLQNDDPTSDYINASHVNVRTCVQYVCTVCVYRILHAVEQLYIHVVEQLYIHVVE